MTRTASTTAVLVPPYTLAIAASLQRPTVQFGFIRPAPPRSSHPVSPTENRL